MQGSTHISNCFTVRLLTISPKTHLSVSYLIVVFRLPPLDARVPASKYVFHLFSPALALFVQNSFFFIGLIYTSGTQHPRRIFLLDIFQWRPGHFQVRPSSEPMTFNQIFISNFRTLVVCLSKAILWMLCINSVRIEAYRCVLYRYNLDERFEYS